MNTDAQSYDTFESNGFIAVQNLCPTDLTKSLLEVTKEKLEEQLAKLEGKDIGIGSAEGYTEICQRSEGRWDVPIDLKNFGIDHKKGPWWPYIAKFLGDDAIVSHQGIVSSAPHSPAQEWHIDSPHDSKEHQPVHAINVLIALEDIDWSMGPTEVAVGSHKFTNHLDNPRLVSDELVYQCDKTTPESLLGEKRKEDFNIWSSEFSTGTTLIFDDRVLHRGGENKSEKYRHVAYFSYSRNGYQQKSYFEASRSLDI